MTTKKGTIEIKQDSEVKLFLKPGLATTGEMDISFFHKESGEEEIENFNLEKGGVEINLSEKGIKTLNGFVFGFGKLFPLPGKEEILLNIEITIDNKSVLILKLEESLTKFMIRVNKV